MRVRDIMTPAPFTVRPTMSVFDARTEMSRRRIRHLLVTDESSLLLGLVTDREIRSALPSQATSLSAWEITELLRRLTVEAVMTRAVITVDPDRDVRMAARIMIDHKIGSLPVLQAGEIVGLVTDTDLLRTLARAGADRAVAV